MSMGCNNDLCFEKIYFSYSDHHNEKKICQNLNLNIKKRPIAAVADNVEVRDVEKVKIMISKKFQFTLLYDKNKSLDKRIASEQLKKIKK